MTVIEDLKQNVDFGIWKLDDKSKTQNKNRKLWRSKQKAFKQNSNL